MFGVIRVLGGDDGNDDSEGRLYSWMGSCAIPKYDLQVRSICSIRPGFALFTCVHDWAADAGGNGFMQTRLELACILFYYFAVEQATRTFQTPCLCTIYRLSFLLYCTVYSSILYRRFQVSRLESMVITARDGENGSRNLPATVEDDTTCGKCCSSRIVAAAVGVNCFLIPFCEKRG